MPCLLVNRSYILTHILIFHLILIYPYISELQIHNYLLYYTFKFKWTLILKVKYMIMLMNCETSLHSRETGDWIYLHRIKVYEGMTWFAGFKAIAVIAGSRSFDIQLHLLKCSFFLSKQNHNLIFTQWCKWKLAQIGYNCFNLIMHLHISDLVVCCWGQSHTDSLSRGIRWQSLSPSSLDGDYVREYTPSYVRKTAFWPM